MAAGGMASCIGSGSRLGVSTLVVVRVWVRVG